MLLARRIAATHLYAHSNKCVAGHRAPSGDLEQSTSWGVGRGDINWGWVGRGCGRFEGNDSFYLLKNAVFSFKVCLGAFVS